jgi:hypothetical protein
MKTTRLKLADFKSSFSVPLALHVVRLTHLGNFGTIRALLFYAEAVFCRTPADTTIFFCGKRKI